jgi:hypothetical protein
VIEQEPKFRLRAPAPANLGGNGEQPLAESAKSDVRHARNGAINKGALQLTFCLHYRRGSGNVAAFDVQDCSLCV